MRESVVKNTQARFDRGEEIKSEGGIFDEGWEDWCLDASWKKPELRAKWDDLSMYD